MTPQAHTMMTAAHTGTGEAFGALAAIFVLAVLAYLRIRKRD